ncbi:MAG: rhomboid family intramembrane serine protease [Bacteroidota bacterium]
MKELVLYIKKNFEKPENGLKKIVIAHVLIGFTILGLQIGFWLTNSSENIENFLSTYFYLSPNWTDLLKKPWTLLSYFFIPKEVHWLIINLGSFILFGHVLTYLLGSRRLFTLYFLGGIAGGLTYIIVCKYAPLFQEKGAHPHPIHLLAGSYAVIVATMTFAPNFFFHQVLLPMPTKYLGGLLLVVPIVRLASREVEAFAQLGSALFGYLYIHFLRYMAKKPPWLQKIGSFLSRIKSFFYYKKRTEQSHPQEKDTKPSPEQLQAIFDKIASKGYQSLTDEEKRQLLNAS